MLSFRKFLRLEKHKTDVAPKAPFLNEFSMESCQSALKNGLYVGV